MMMASLIGIISSPVVRRVSETNPKGKQSIRLGPLYSNIGWWLHQQGGILGYLLKGKRQLLERIMGLATHNPVADVDFYRDRVIADLESVKDREKHLSWLYTYLEMKRVGIDIANPKEGCLQETVDTKQRVEVMKEAFYKGVTIGFHFPDVFREYWGNTYQKVVDDEPKGPERNSGPSKTKLETAFGGVVVNMINTILNWNRLEGYEVLNREDELTLESILGDYAWVKDEGGVV